MGQKRHVLRAVEIVTESEPRIVVGQLYDELLGVLADLTNEYRRLIPRARRWPGALPADVTLQTLQQDMDSAQWVMGGLLSRYSFSPASPE